MAYYSQKSETRAERYRRRLKMGQYLRLKDLSTMPPSSDTTIQPSDDKTPAVTAVLNPPTVS